MNSTRKETYEDIVLKVKEFHKEHKMKEYKIVKVEVWTYFVEAETKEESEQKEKAGDYEHADQEASITISSAFSSEEVND